MNARGSTEVIVASIGLSMGVLTQESLHHDRHHGDDHHHGDAADAALGAARGCRCRRRRRGSRARSWKPGASCPSSSACCWRSMKAPTASSPRGSPGSIAGSRGKPTTIIELAPQHSSAETVRLSEQQATEQVRTAAAGTVTLAADRDEKTRGSVDVTLRALRRDGYRSRRRRGAKRLRPADRRDGEDTHRERWNSVRRSPVSSAASMARLRSRSPAGRSPPATSRSAGSSSRSTAPTFRAVRRKPASRWRGPPDRA